MDDTVRAANKLIDDHGRHAAGEAFLLALEARVMQDRQSEFHWLDVAVEIFYLQRCRVRFEAAI